MKKIVISICSLLFVALLPQCGTKKNCCQKSSHAETKRISGPLAEKEINWSKEDLQ